MRDTKNHGKHAAFYPTEPVGRKQKRGVDFSRHRKRRSMHNASQGSYKSQSKSALRFGLRGSIHQDQIEYISERTCDQLPTGRKRAPRTPFGTHGERPHDHNAKPTSIAQAGDSVRR
jgi:hypothetical protein